MTLAPPRAAPARVPAAPAAGSVSAILVVHDGEPWLVDSLDALAVQSRPPERLVVVDTGSTDTSASILAGHAGIRRTITAVDV